MLRKENLPARIMTTENEIRLVTDGNIAGKLKTKVYFSHLYNLVEKGVIENINGLVRRYIPNKANFRGILNTMITKIWVKLNNRLRKKNGFVKPREVIKKNYM